jgi:hypothetical protein
VSTFATTRVALPTGVDIHNHIINDPSVLLCVLQVAQLAGMCWLVTVLTAARAPTALEEPTPWRTHPSSSHVLQT